MPNTLRLLLVDDDVVDREVVKRALNTAGVRADVSEFDAAEPALTALIGGGVFDCALFDLRLPDRDGLELLKEVRAAGFDLPVIFLTGQGSEEVAVDLMKSGASDYLPKGQLLPARLRDSIGHSLRMVRTERAQRLADISLRESEANFRRLAENLPDAVVRFDRHGRHRYINRPVPWSYETTAMAMIGRTIAEGGCEPSVIAPLEAALGRALAGTPGQVTVYLPSFRTLPPEVACDETVFEEIPRWVEVRFVPERDASLSGNSGPALDQVSDVLAICRDVTAEVLRTREEARHAEFERQLIGIVSHDLRNPIGAILMATSLLAKNLGPDVDPRAARTLELLGRSGQRAQRMVSDILDFTKARLGGGIPMRLSDCHLNEVIDHVVAEHRAAYPARVIELEVTGDAHGNFDADRLAQAVANLVTNAIAYSPPAEPVRVLVDGTRLDIAIRVTNRGAPIPEDVLPMLFKPFQRGTNVLSDKDASRSVGLGLFIVEQIVQGHRGRIEVTSQDGLTTFCMVIPRRPPSGRMRAVTLTNLEAIS